MKNRIRKILFSGLSIFTGYCLGEFFPGLKAMIRNNPWMIIPIMVIVIALLIVYYFLYEKADQRDMKTVIFKVLPTLKFDKKRLTDTNVSKIVDPPNLCELLNGNDAVESRILNKKQRVDLSDDSCVLQISFIPIDKNGQTIMWKRMPKYHVMKNGVGSVLISFSPYAQKYSQVFTGLGELQVAGSVSISEKNLDGKLVTKSNVGIHKITLDDIYSREVPKKSGVSSNFEFVGAFWLPAKRDDNGRKTAPAYCFYVYAVRYNADFSQQNEVDEIFGREEKGFWGRKKIIYLGKDNDKKMLVLNLGEVDSLLENGKIKLGKMDAFIAGNYQTFLNESGDVDESLV